MTTSTKMPRAQLTIEALEDRLALSLTSATLNPGGVLLAFSNDSASNVSITRSGSVTTIRDTTNGFSRSFGGVSKVQVVGGASADRIVMNVPTLRLEAWGNGGNDYLEGYNAADSLVGGSGDDVLKGYGGNDQMWGEAGNDDLYGMAGYDYLYGGADNDFLDTGSTGEYRDGGSGYDFNAYVTAVGGTQRDDVHQGSGPTCWLLASLSAVASRVNMSNRISYLGNGTYRVTLFTAAGATRYQYVNFTGERNNADPNFNPNQEGESWVVIMQRAVLQQMGLSTTSPPGGNPVNALPMLTGRAANWYGTPSASTGILGNSDAERIRTALAAGKYVAMCTFGEGTALATSKLVNWHCYNVVGITRSVVWRGIVPEYQYSVTVRNPWGYDGGSGSGNTGDALINLSWSEFARSISGYAVG